MFYKLLFAPLLFCSMVASAQNWQFGPEIGVNQIKLDGGYSGKTYALGWHVGGFIQFDVNEFFSLRSGAHFTQKKQLYSSADTSLQSIFALIGLDGIDQFDLNTYTTVNGRTTQNYLEIPVLAKFNYNGFGFYSGLYGAFQFKSVNKEIKISNTPILSVLNTDSLGFLSALIPPATVTSENIIENASNLRKFDFGAKFGASYQFDRLELNLTYSLGLLDYRQDNGGLEKQRHQYFQMSMTYNFGAEGNNKGVWKSNRLK